MGLTEERAQWIWDLMKNHAGWVEYRADFLDEHGIEEWEMDTLLHYMNLAVKHFGLDAVYDAEYGPSVEVD